MAAAVGKWVDANVQTIGWWIGDTVEMSMNGISQPSGPKVARWRRCRDGFPRAPCSMLPFADRMISTRKISVSTDHSCHLLQRASGLVESSAKRMCLSNTLSEVIFALLVSYRRHRLRTPCAAMKRLRGAASPALSPAFDPPAEVAKERTLITDAPVAVADLVRPPAIDDGTPLFHNRLDRGPCEGRARRRVVFLHVAEIVADALPRPGVRAGDDQGRERGERFASHGVATFRCPPEINTALVIGD